MGEPKPSPVRLAVSGPECSGVYAKMIVHDVPWTWVIASDGQSLWFEDVAAAENWIERHPAPQPHNIGESA